MIVVVGVESGRFRVTSEVTTKYAALGTDSLVEVLVALGFDSKNPNHCVVCSSSVDFPEDEGASAVNVRQIVGEALARTVKP